MFGTMDRRTRIRHFAEGFLSAFNLFPEPRNIEIRFKRRTPEERMRETWLRVGGHLRRAMNEVGDDIRRPEGDGPRR